MGIINIDVPLHGLSQAKFALPQVADKPILFPAGAVCNAIDLVGRNVPRCAKAVANMRVVSENPCSLQTAALGMFHHHWLH
jgi:hypothetical protein